MRLLRQLAVAVLRSELTEREAAARKLAEQAYHGARQPGKRGRIFWDGYAAGVAAVRKGQQEAL